MPKLLRGDRWNFNPENIDASFSSNHPQDFTSEDVPQSLNELDESEEIKEYTEIVLNSPFYATGKQDGG